MLRNLVSTEEQAILLFYFYENSQDFSYSFSTSKVFESLSDYEKEKSKKTLSPETKIFKKCVLPCEDSSTQSTLLQNTIQFQV